MSSPVSCCPSVHSGRGRASEGDAGLPRLPPLCPAHRPVQCVRQDGLLMCLPLRPPWHAVLRRGPRGVGSLRGGSRAPVPQQLSLVRASRGRHGRPRALAAGGPRVPGGYTGARSPNTLSRDRSYLSLVPPWHVPCDSDPERWPLSCWPAESSRQKRHSLVPSCSCVFTYPDGIRTGRPRRPTGHSPVDSARRPHRQRWSRLRRF